MPTNAQLLERIAALEALIVAAPVATSKAAARYRTGKRDANGNVPGGFACSATPPCSRILRTVKNAASHVQPDGHDAR